MDRINEFNDAMNAQQCDIIAKCAGIKGTKPADFMLLKRETSNKIKDLEYDTPGQIAAKLSMM